MTKQDALELLGVRTQQEAAALLCLTRSAWGQWPDPLRPRQVHEVLGAAVRARRLRVQSEYAEAVEAALSSSCPQRAA